MRTAWLLLLLTGCSGGGSTVSDAARPSDAAMALDASTPTYSSFAQPFFMTYCVSCHPSASSTRDFTQYSVIQTNAHNIACGVSPTALAGCSGNPAPSQFPIGTGPHPSDAERNELVLWIMNGLPQ
jgi:hypothetical protein